MEMTAAERNLYPGALPHVASWPAGRALDSNAGSPISSQALCVSVFGALAGRPHRGQITTAILAAAGLEPPTGSSRPLVDCEVRGQRVLLNEYGGPNATSPDALLTWPKAVLVVESKFTEPLGRCSHAARGDCSGDHAVGSDMKTGTDAACRLTVQDGSRTPRRYWEVGTEIFQPAALATPRRPCPFRDGGYQLMRSLCFSSALASETGASWFGLLVALTDGAGQAAHTRAELDAFLDLVRPELRSRVGVVSYERIAWILEGFGEEDLAVWLKAYLDRGLAAAAKPRGT
jgi:hypothetical protein